MPEPMIVAVRSSAAGSSGGQLRLRQRFLRRGQRQRDEAIHLPLVFRRDDAIGVESGGRILAAIGDDAGDLGRQVAHHFVRQPAEARLTRDQPLPYHVHSAAKRRHDAHAGDDDARGAHERMPESAGRKLRRYVSFAASVKKAAGYGRRATGSGLRTTGRRASAAVDTPTRPVRAVLSALLESQLQSIELLFDPMKRVVADLVGCRATRGRRCGRRQAPAVELSHQPTLPTPDRPGRHARS